MKTKVTFDRTAWSGDASQWDTPEAYCRDCLIDLNESGQPKTKDKCKLPYRKPGSDRPNINAIHAIASRINQTDAPAEALRSAARKVASWIRQDGKEVPPNISRLTTRDFNTTTLLKAQNKWWFIGFYSNNYMDREQEIITKDAHEEYAQFVADSGLRPPVTLLHQPRIPDKYLRAATAAYMAGLWPVDKLNQFLKEVYKDYAVAETVAVVSVKGFNVVLGQVYDDRVSTVKKILDSDMDWRMSHGFIPLSKDGSIINKYVSLEFTILPGEMAANLLTAANFKEEDMKTKLTDEQTEKIQSILDKEKVRTVEEVIDAIRPLLDDVLPSKDVDEEVTEEVTEEVAAEEEENVEEKVLEYVMEKLDVAGLQQTLKSFNEALQALYARQERVEKDSDEVLDQKVANLYTPSWPVFKYETGVEDETVLETLKDKGHAGKEPINMLDEMFWKPFAGGH